MCDTWSIYVTRDQNPLTETVLSPEGNGATTKIASGSQSSWEAKDIASSHKGMVVLISSNAGAILANKLKGNAPILTSI